MVQIIPAILATTEEQYQKDLSKLSSSESLIEGWIHIDFADNKFVQNQTIRPDVTEKTSDNFNKEAHLMVSNPKDWIDDLIKAKFKRVIVHVEAEGVEESLDYAKSKGLEVGLAVKNETAIEKLAPFVSKIDTILLMGIIPGFQGQSFIPETLDRISQVKGNNWPPRVGVDGAVKDTNIKEIIEKGADFVIMGSYLLDGDVEENLEVIWEKIND